MIDGDRISSSTTGKWVTGEASSSEKNYAVLEFSESHTLTGINIVALQSDNGTEIPNADMTTTNVQRYYTVYSQKNDGTWEQITKVTAINGKKMDPALMQIRISWFCSIRMAAKREVYCPVTFLPMKSYYF